METQQFLKKVIDNLLQYSYSKDRMSKKHVSDLSDSNEITRKNLSLFRKEYEEEKSKISLESQQERNELLKKYTAKEGKINDDSVKRIEMYTKIQQTEMKELSAPYISKHIHLIYEYVAEYIFNHLEEDLTDPQKISSALKPILDLNLKLIIKDYLEEYMMIYTKINEGFQYVFNLCKINEISIDEIEILPSGKECTDFVSDLDVPRVCDCLKETDNLLFVTVSKLNYEDTDTYHAVCYSREHIREMIRTNMRKYQCIENDPKIYVLLSIGSNGINVYIPLLTAIMILQSDKVIFYLMNYDVIKYCYRNWITKEFDKSASIMYVAKCGGFNCAPKGWTGGGG
jgi:hypothetical protein